jgi:hypothetical protein
VSGTTGDTAGSESPRRVRPASRRDPSTGDEQKSRSVSGNRRYQGECFGTLAGGKDRKAGAGARYAASRPSVIALAPRVGLTDTLLSAFMSGDLTFQRVKTPSCSPVMAAGLAGHV